MGDIVRESRAVSSNRSSQVEGCRRETSSFENRGNPTLGANTPRNLQSRRQQKLPTKTRQVVQQSYKVGRLLGEFERIVLLGSRSFRARLQGDQLASWLSLTLQWCKQSASWMLLSSSLSSCPSPVRTQSHPSPVRVALHQ